MSRGIQNVDTESIIFKLQHRRCHGNTSFLFNLHPVRYRMSGCTLPARLMAPPYNRNFSVSVVLPASGCEIMAKVLLLLISASYLLFIATFLPVVFLFLLFYLLQHRFSGNISGYSKVIEHCCTDIRKSFSRTEIFRSYMLSVHDTRRMLP